MGHDNYATKKIESSIYGHVCAYCFNSNLVIDDDFGEKGSYNGTIYYCTCEKAKLEQSMKRELENVQNKEDEIKSKFTDILNENKVEQSKFILKNELYNTLRSNVYGNLDNLNDDELIELFKESLKEYRDEYCN